MDHAAELRESHVEPHLARRQPIEKGPQTFLGVCMFSHPTPGCRTQKLVASHFAFILLSKKAV